MNAIIKWLQGFNMENISSFFEIVLGVALFSLVFLCVNASKYQAEGYVLMIVFSLAVAAVIIWQRKLQKKKRIKEEFPHDGLEGLFKGFSVMAISEVGFFLTISAVIITGLFFWKEILSLIVESIVPVSLITLGLAIVIWRVMAQNKKEYQERRYVNKILMDKGIEPLKE